MNVRIVEVFSSMQGEGLRTGERQVFVRFGGCNLRCSYCDESAGRSRAGRLWSISRVQGAVLALVRRRPHRAVSWTGGEPLLHSAALHPLMRFSRSLGLENHMETNGTLPGRLRALLPLVDLIAMDVKFPSASGRSTWAAHRAFLALAPEKTFVKVVLTAGTSEGEFERLLMLMEGYPGVPLFLQPVTARPGSSGGAIPARRALTFLLEARRRLSDVRLSPQWHPIWGVR